MSKKVKNLEDFIKKANKVHDNKYGYIKSIYSDNACIMIITCPIEGHGDFLKNAGNHLSGQGCQKCVKCHRYTTEEFIKKANKVHNNKYLYPKTSYETTKKKIIITCPILGHGDFTQKPNGHLTGEGCPKCALDDRRKSIEKFIKEANSIHDFKYKYQSFIYVGDKIKGDIICEELDLFGEKHGVFPQSPRSHLAGRGCPKCGKERSSLATYSNKFFKNHPEMKNKNAILYVVKFISKTDNSQFYKIGITQNSIKRRFNDIGEYYLIEEIFILNTNLFNAYYLEQKYLKEIKKTQIRPQNTILKNKGESECFYANLIFINELIRSIQLHTEDGNHDPSVPNVSIEIPAFS